MIDMHCHILPGIDDGAEDTKTALNMARIAVKDGVETIIATPHINHSLVASDEIAQRVAKFNDLLQVEAVALEVVPGAEVASHIDLQHWPSYGLNRTRYVLVEFPHSHWPPTAERLLSAAQDKGLLPILAHPERNPGIMKRPELLLALVENGIKAQITTESLLGTFGPAIQQCCFYLLRKGVVHFIASDAHSGKYRTPVLSKAKKMAGKIIGREKAELLVSDNPRRVLQGVGI